MLKASGSLAAACSLQVAQIAGPIITVPVKIKDHLAVGNRPVQPGAAVHRRFLCSAPAWLSQLAATLLLLLTIHTNFP